MAKKIYKNFEEWWREGKHGFSSASRDYAKELWKDLEPTITAKRGDWERLLIEETIESLEFTHKLRHDVFAYLKEFNLEKVAGIGIWRWILDRRLAETTRKKSRRTRCQKDPQLKKK